MQGRRPRVLLGVSGSIAAYKGVELLRALSKAGADVQVALTRGARAFVQPLTFEAISGRPVLTDVLAVDGGQIGHVERAHEVDLLLVAPASANLIARLAHGMADDPVTAIALSTEARRMFAPAMESGMWRDTATTDNVATLERRGWVRVGPASGALASGRSGVGRMAEPEEIAACALALLGPQNLAGRRVVITAGPTWEPLDPVRLLTNRSTGSMGIAIANAAARRGADVQLVLGPTHLRPAAGVVVHAVETAEQMLAAASAIDDVDVLIATAAVSDFRPRAAQDRKLKRGHAGADVLQLDENPDVLATLSARWRATRPELVVVGFAAETEDLVANARDKLARKGCDLVIGNVVGAARGFGAGETEVVAVRAEGETAFGPATKDAVAEFVLDQVVSVEEQRSRA
ncbi:MAG: bifunctional phosphopantothenoylcysteine decarboxylase/phosphopantothenate--cysteine ligase CoaBC [Deltaproteobacteria bacterium]